MPADTLAMPADTLAMPADSLAASKDSLVVEEPPKDTTKVAFLWGSKHVRLFRRDMQMASDSLTYTDLDSLVRVYQDPIFYNEGRRQYASDSMYIVIKDQQMQKAHLLSNAFITMEEGPGTYNQVRGAEMVAYFDSTTALTRFDALGGAASLFFLEENGALATVNKVETKMIYATFKDGDIERMYYYDNPKNDGYPTVQLAQDDKQLKGFRWEPERRPKSPADVTSLVPRRSERTSYLARPHADFKQTELYFPGYINQIYRDIAIRDSLEVVRQRQKQQEQEALEKAAPADTLAAPVKEEKEPVKTDEKPAVKDSTAAEKPAVSDTLSAPKPLTAAELKALEKAQKKAEREKKKAERQAALEAKWAEQDRIYEEKQAAKAQRKLDKERARKLKMLRKQEKKAQKERARFEKYLKKEREKALKKKHSK